MTAGISTVDDLRSRCHVDDLTGCWHWRLAINAGVPRVFVPHPLTGKRFVTSGPNAAYLLTRGVMQANRKAYRTCQVFDCVNPDHVKAWTREEFGRFISRAGTWRNVPRRIAANTANRRGCARLNIETAREIRRAEGSQRQIGARFGLPQSYVSAIKRGQVWREGPASSVFEWADRI